MGVAVTMGVAVGVAVAVAVGVAVGVGVGDAGAAAKPDNCRIPVLNNSVLIPVTGSIEYSSPVGEHPYKVPSGANAISEMTASIGPIGASTPVT